MCVRAIFSTAFCICMCGEHSVLTTPYHRRLIVDSRLTMHEQRCVRGAGRVWRRADGAQRTHGVVHQTAGLCGFLLHFRVTDLWPCHLRFQAKILLYSRAHMLHQYPHCILSCIPCNSNAYTRHILSTEISNRCA